MTEQRPYHMSVMTQEVIDALHIKKNGIYVDATFGGGGHTKAILDAEQTCSVIAFDWDMIALETNGDPLVSIYGNRLSLIWANFAHITSKLKKIGITAVDGIIADFGTSQNQIFERAGFSFDKDSPLDMRMSPAHQKITAAYIIAKWSESALIALLRDYAQEPKARTIARALVAERSKQRITTTRQLAYIIERTIGHTHQRTKKYIHPATLTFQALRIAVNRELDNIQAFLPAAFDLLKPGGRLACITFHSLEDGLVKHYFKDKVKGDHPEGILLDDKGITASEQEKARNKSSRSARLRTIERI
jgi:16S rRNA (cytosine1402-N4)-methyltransferase